MVDTIRGPVTSIIDGDTFDIQVTHVGTANQFQYNALERIRVASIDAPELNSLLGQRSKFALERRLSGRQVRCHVQARDTYQRIVADVNVI